MIRRLAIASIVALVLGGCATYDSGYRHGYGDGSYRGDYNDGYYAAAENGYGDYYYDRPQIVWNEPYGYGYPWSGFGYGFSLRYGYDPWYGYGYPYGGYRPWPRHNHNDHDADDPPGGWSNNHHVGGVRAQAVASPNDGSGVRIDKPVRQSSPDRYQRDASHFERREPSGNRPHSHDAPQR
jgi:hypothetical protein